MRQRYDNQHLPIETLRSFVTCVDKGGVTKAGASLGLSQPAVSQQIKRLEQIVGGALFAQSSAGLNLTERGFAIIQYARRILALNDQVFLLSGSTLLKRPVQIAMPHWLADRRLEQIIQGCSAVVGTENVNFRCESYQAIRRGLLDGYIDAAFLCDVTDRPGAVAAEWWEPLIWLKARSLALAPAAPVPIVSSDGSLSDRVASKAFDAAGVFYSVGFRSPDFGARIAAVNSGRGVMVASERCVRDDLVIAREPHLPELPHIMCGIYIREGFDGAQHAALLDAFESAVRPPSLSGLSRLSRKSSAIRPRARSRKEA